MFHDMMMLKLQVMNGQHAQHMQDLFHSHWPAADVVPINAAAVSTDQVGDMYFYPSTESTVAWNYAAVVSQKTTPDAVLLSLVPALVFSGLRSIGVGRQYITAGANFGGPTKASWTSGANSQTASVTASTVGAAITAGSVPSWATGMFGKYLIADPSYSTANGGMGGDVSTYPLNGDYVVPMCGGKDKTSVCLG